MVGPGHGTDRHEHHDALPGRPFGKNGQPSRVTRLDDRNRRNPLSLRLGNGQVRGKKSRHLTEGPVARHQGAGGALLQNLRLCRGNDLPCLDAPDVLRNAQDAVRVMACQVVIDEHIGHDRGMLLGGTCRPEDRRGQGMENLFGQSRHVTLLPQAAEFRKGADTKSVIRSDARSLSGAGIYWDSQACQAECCRKDVHNPDQRRGTEKVPPAGHLRQPCDTCKRYRSGERIIAVVWSGQ